MKIDEFLNEFGNWMNSSENEFNFSLNKKIKDKVFPKNSKIIKNISLDFGVFEEVKKDFIKFGGKIIGQDNCGNLLIEVKSGTFYLNSKYTY